jgi:hypothetical protein
MEHFSYRACAFLFRLFFWLWAAPVIGLAVSLGPALNATDLGRLVLGSIAIALFGWFLVAAPWLAEQAATRYLHDLSGSLEAVRFALSEARLRLSLLPVVGRLFAPPRAAGDSPVNPK